jgi:hypothetical protein
MEENYEQSVVLLRDKTFVQQHTYSNHLLKVFQMLSGHSTSSTKSEALPELIVAIKWAKDLEISLQIDFYHLQKLTKTKSKEGIYSNGMIQLNDKTLFTRKTLVYNIDTNENYYVEDKENPSLKKIPWDSALEYRICLKEEKRKYIVVIFSATRYELLRILANLDNIKYLKNEILKESQVQFTKALMLTLVKGYQSEEVYIAMMNLAGVQGYNDEVQRSYTSQISMSNSKFHDNYLKDSSVISLRVDQMVQSEIFQSRIGSEQPNNEIASSQFGGPKQKESQKNEIKEAGKETEFEKKANRSLKMYSSEPEMNLIGSKINDAKGASKVINSVLNFPEQNQAQNFTKKSIVNISEISQEPSASMLISKGNIGVSEIKSSKLAANLPDPQDPTQKSNFTKLIQKSVVENKSQMVAEEKAIFESSWKKPSTIGLERSKIIRPGLEQSNLSSQMVVSNHRKQVPELVKGDLSKVSMMSEGVLMDIGYNFNQMSYMAKDASKNQDFSIESLILPSTVDHKKIEVKIYEIQYKVDTQKNGITVSRRLLKSFPVSDRKKVYLADIDKFVLVLEEKLKLEHQNQSELYELEIIYDKSSLESVNLPGGLLFELSKQEGPLSIPIKVLNTHLLLNLCPGTISNNKDRKVRTSSRWMTNILENRDRNKNLNEQIERLMSVGIKKREAKEMGPGYSLYLPANYHLCLWLLVAKKFSRAEQTDLPETNTPKPCSETSLFNTLFLPAPDSSGTPSNHRVTLHFHRLLRTIEKQAQLYLMSDFLPYTGLLHTVKAHYFTSSSNRYRIVQFLFTNIMADYFNLNQDDTHGTKNLLFSKNFRSVARDYLVLHSFINTHCQNLLKVSRASINDLVLWILDNILSVNIGVLKEHAGIQHLHFLYMMKIKNKDDSASNFGWRINLYLHISILSRLEQILEEREVCLFQTHHSIDVLYSLVTGQNAFYESFVTEFLEFDKGLQNLKKSDSIVSNIFKGTPQKLSMHLNRAEEIYSNMSKNTDLRKIYEQNVLENVLIFQLTKLGLRPNEMINLVKSEHKEAKRRLTVMVHGVYNRERADDELFVTLTVDKIEYCANEQNAFEINKTDIYNPSVMIRLHKIGDDLLFKDNNSAIGSCTLQLRRFKTNIVHKTTMKIQCERTGREYVVVMSLAIQIAIQSVDEHLRHDEQVQFAFIGNYGHLLIGDFQNPISNFENLIKAKVTAEYESLGLELQNQTFNQKYTSSKVLGHEIKTNLKMMERAERVKIREELLSRNLNTFGLSIKLLLFSNNFELMEDFVIRYFGSSLMSISASESVYLVQQMLEIIGVKVHLLELVSYLETFLKRTLSAKLESCWVLLSEERKDKGSHFIDLKGPMLELVSWLSYRRNSGVLQYGNQEELYLIKEMITKLGVKGKVGEKNLLSIKYTLRDISVTEAVYFNKDFRCIHKRQNTGEQSSVETALFSNQFSIDLSPLDCFQLSKPDLTKVFTQFPLIDYARFCCHNLYF